MSGATEPKPLVSIALPVFNGERFLREAILSLLDQTFRDFELIIGDNGSTDATERICREATEDSRVRYLRSPDNRGAAWNYNRLFPEASGKYFKWAAHDDRYEPMWLERCVTALEADDGIVLAYTRTVETDSDGRVLEYYPALPYASGNRPSDRAHDVLAKRSRCFEAFGLARRDALETTGLIGPYTSSDRTLILELALRGRFHESHEYLFLHREHPGRSMRAFPDARARRAWFEPNKEGKRSFPHWRLLAEYARAILRAPVAVSEKFRTFVYVARWTLRNTGALRKDLSLGRRKVVAPAAGPATHDLSPASEDGARVRTPSNVAKSI